MGQIKAERFTALKAKVKAECLRRCQVGSVAGYGGAAYDYATPPAAGKVIRQEHRDKLSGPLNAINSNVIPATSGARPVLEAELADMEAKVMAWSARSITDQSGSDCKSGCTGTCYTTCTTGCTGCGSGCPSSCSGCGSGCPNSCTGCGSGCPTSCSTCSSGCADECTGTATGKLLVTMIAAINEFERANLLERQREGIAIAKREGKYHGRKPVAVPDLSRHYERYMNREISKAALARELGISRPTLDRLFGEYRKGRN